MYKDCVITAISDLAFYGKVLIRYSDKSDKNVVLKLTLNRNKTVTGITAYTNGIITDNLKFKTMEQLTEHLGKIKDRVYLIEVA